MTYIAEKFFLQYESKIYKLLAWTTRNKFKLINFYKYWWFIPVLIALDINEIALKMHSSEICAKALGVSRSNHFKRIVELGNIKKIKKKTLNEIGRVDFLFGSPPCDDLSMVNFLRRGALGIEKKFLLNWVFWRMSDWQFLPNRS